MFKKLIIFLSFLLCACSNQKMDNKEIIINDEPEIQIEEKIEEEIEINEEAVENESNNKPITDNKQSNNKTSGNSSNTTSNTNKDDKKSNSNSNTYVVEEKKESSEKKQETNIWDELGISEYDYYHKPMWSWARVDYKTHDECIKAGEALGYEIISYTCTNINSYSGDYLGDMLIVKYPKN